ncbi:MULTISPECIES: class-III pyridoxal-phosphate-dependent aminotransferase [Haloprofundus]|uniref:class-III pyridoxal-phosphate-dependent aminotransferase n=1 Tax=Haloprofundus TaxID=1911573 RepID=UPI000E43FEF4|nr:MULTISPECIES: aminotransferase class III-fold pyridoxal phosphate-dependent enzyme [Haloprofundus]QCJ46617.1 aminotransferase class III-fold pyridoxal phosphate-dependent enzyme [Haloprofundus sp. MHR1]
MDRETVTPSVEAMPGRRARQWAERHREHAAPSTYVYDFVWDTSAPAEGPFCTDVDGNVLLDFTSHVAAAPLGYNNPKIMEPMSEFDLVDPLKIAGQDFYASSGHEFDDDPLPGPAGLMERLVDATDHYGMDTVFLSNSGAEAVENAIKISYDHADGGKYGITFDGAFHGRTLGALSLNRSKEVYRRKFPEISGVHDMPYCDDRTCSEDSCSCGFFVDGTSRLREKLHPKRGHINPEELSYIILEPIQGEGGYRIPSDAFMRELADLVDEYDITLVADEIQSGVGRTGKMWGSDHFPIEPDVITAAKSLRVGATISKEEIFPAEKSRISSTWGAGDIIASLQGALTLDAIEEYDLMDNAVVRGEQFLETLADADLPGVEDLRGKGLMLAVEFETKEHRDAVQEAALKRGLLTLSCGYKVLRILPPLDVTEREISLGCDLLCEAIEATA